MRIVSEAELTAVLSRVAGVPQVVVSGNFATPVTALAVVDKALAEYRLFALNAQPGFPDRRRAAQPADARPELRDAGRRLGFALR